MLFWIREIAGWLLVLVSLVMVWMGLTFVSDSDTPRIVEAGLILFAALGLLRMGILLIRISTAARICLKEPSGSPNRRS